MKTKRFEHGYFIYAGTHGDRKGGWYGLRGGFVPVSFLESDSYFGLLEDEGWELVTVIRIDEYTTEYYFKRQVE